MIIHLKCSHLQNSSLTQDSHKVMRSLFLIPVKPFLAKLVHVSVKPQIFSFWAGNGQIMKSWKQNPSLNPYMMSYWWVSVVRGLLKSPFTDIYSFIASPRLSLFAFPSSDQYFIARSFTMKAMEDQVVQEEPGYQDDEVNLWLKMVENYVQQMFEAILIVLWSPWRDRRSPKPIREFSAFKILF